MVTLKRPTAAQREGLKSIQIDAGSGKMSFSFATEKILRNHVTTITNLEDEVNGEVHTIRTGADLAASSNPKLQRLVDELKAEITSDLSLDEDESGN